MTQLAATTETVAEPPRRISARQPWLIAGGVYTLLLILCALIAYWLMFSQFAPYDDEGFFLYSLKLFTDGHPLYSSVFSDYGPFYYELFGGVFAVLGHGVTTDAGRMIQLTIWLGSSLGLGLAAHRLTGRLSIGVVTLATAFTLMISLTNEPMHPEALIAALVTTMVVVAAFALPRWPRASLAALGALTGALLLTKINVGGYAAIAVGFAAVMAGPSLVRYRPLRWLAILAFVLVGPAVMAGNLNSTWVQSYAAVAGLSALAIAFVAVPVDIGPVGPDESSDWPRWLLTGFFGCLLVVLVLVFAQGTSVGALLDQLISVPARQSSVLTIPITLNPEVVWWSLAAAGLAWALRRLGPVGVDPATAAPSLWGGAFRALAGVAILLSLGSQFPFGIAPNAPFALAMPLAWVAALPSRRDLPGSRARLIRLLIPSLAALQALVAYPVAGSQEYLGAVLFVLCGAICLADASSELVAWNAIQRFSGQVAATTMTALFVVLAIGATFQYLVQPISSAHARYRAGTPLAISGASRLRLGPPVTGTLVPVVDFLRTNCKTLISLPGLYSFNLWTGLPTPSPLTGAQPWWELLSASQQRSVLAAAKASPGLCAVRDDVDATSYSQTGSPPPRVPLVAYIEDDFKPLARFGDYLVETRQ